MITARHISIVALLVSAFLAAARSGSSTADPPDLKDAATYVNEKFAAYEVLARVRGLVDRHDWDRAAEAYDAIIERFGDVLVKAPTPASSRPDDAGFDAFVGFPTLVIDELTAGPAPLLLAYRHHYESTARAALARPASQPSDSLRIARRYFPTSAAASVLEQAADRFFESGDFNVAGRMYGQLAAQHPDRATRGAHWLAKQALCAAWTGDRSAAERYLASTQPGTDVTVDWGAQRQSAKDFLRKHLPPVTSQPANASAFAAGTTRSVLAPSPVPSISPEARMWQFTTAPSGAAPGDAESENAGDNADSHKLAVQSAQQFSMLPFAADGLIVFSDRLNVWAVDPANADRVAWHYELDSAKTEGSDRNWSGQDEPPPLFTLSAANGRIYAHLDRIEPEHADGAQGGASTLVCLDAHTGELIWHRDVSILGGPFDDCRLDGAPLIVGDKLIVVARRRKPFGFEACILAAFDARSGTALWQTHLGEAATGGYGYHRPTRTFPAAAGNRVFVHSNIGTIAAVDADDGRIAWLRRYPSAYGMSEAWPGRSNGDAHPWQYSPTLLWRDCVVMLPLDIDQLLVLRQEDGQIVQRVAPAVLRSPDSVLAVDGDRLIALGAWVVSYDLAAKRTDWERSLPAGRLYGRGALSDSIFVPTEVALLRYPLAGGAPESYSWSATAAGNVLPRPEQVVIAGDHVLRGLVQKDAAFARLEARLAADTTDATPALALAELAFETREDERGLAAIDEAIRRARLATRMLDGPLKQRIYGICTRRAEVLYARAQELPDAGPALLRSALALLDRAAACAPDADAEVRYRMLRADVLAASNNHAAAVTTCQQVLSDPGLSRRLILTDGRRIVAGGPAAQQRIARWITEQGRRVYNDVERVAAVKLRAALASDDLAALQVVSERYPNSRAACEALSHQAMLLRKAGSNEQAVRALRHAILLADATDAPPLIRQQADALFAANQIGSAVTLLARAARQYPAARFTVDSGNIGFADLRRALMKKSADVFPNIHPPLARIYTRELSGPAALLTPSLDSPSARAPSEFLIYQGERVHCYASATGRPAWPQPFKCAAKPALLFNEGRTAVLATPQQLIGVDLDRGVAVWTIGSSPEDAALPIMDPERIAHFTVHARAGERCFSANDRGELVCTNVTSGHTDWRITTQPAIGTRMAADSRWLAYAAWEDRRNIVVLVDAATGQIAQRIKLAAERPMQRLLFTDDGALLAVTTTSLHKIDTDTGRLLWSTPLDGPASMASLGLTSELLLLSTDSVTLNRVDLLTGAPHNPTPPLAAAGNDTLRCTRLGGRIYVTSQTALNAIDAFTGEIEWEISDIHINEWLGPTLENGDLLLIADNMNHPRFEGLRLALTCIDGTTGARRTIAAAATQPATATGLVLDGVDNVQLCRDAVVVLSNQIISAYGNQPGRTENPK